jgi:hypothetical protein
MLSQDIRLACCRSSISQEKKPLEALNEDMQEKNCMLPNLILNYKGLPQRILTWHMITRIA